MISVEETEDGFIYYYEGRGTQEDASPRYGVLCWWLTDDRSAFINEGTDSNRIDHYNEGPTFS